MRHFTLPVFAAALILANPVHAQDNQPENEMVERLNDPAFQNDMATMMAGVMTAMMDLPIGQFAGVLDQTIPPEMRRDDDLATIDPDTTLGDLARRDDPDFDRNAEEKMRQGTAMMGAMAAQFAALVPQLQTMIGTIKRRTEPDE